MTNVCVSHTMLSSIAQKACHNPKIILVGHSMGGLVARSVPLLHPFTRPHIFNLVTLATPHDGLPYAFDASLANFYQFLRKEENPLMTISISGGIRDEMIPPEACRVGNDNNMTMSVSGDLALLSLLLQLLSILC